ncbi:hypothetical protein AAC387_Pa09g0799 [Persea americana]
MATPRQKGRDGDRHLFGISHDICLALAKASCHIASAARRIDRLDSLCEEINQMGSSSDAQLTTVRSMSVELDFSVFPTPPFPPTKTHLRVS